MSSVDVLGLNFSLDELKEENPEEVEQNIKSVNKMLEHNKGIALVHSYFGSRWFYNYIFEPLYYGDRKNECIIVIINRKGSTESILVGCGKKAIKKLTKYAKRHKYFFMTNKYRSI